MKMFGLALVGLVFSFGAAPAQAGVLATAPALGAYPTTQTLYCDILNVNTSPKNVTVEIYDYFGNLITGPLTQTLGPNQGTALGDGTGQGATCRFTVDGSPKKYRAMAIYDNGSAYTVSVPAY